MTDIQIQGEVAPGFEKVADAFADNFKLRGDTGAACTVYVSGKPVVDIWAGTTGQAPWTRDTKSVVFSASKGILTVLLLMAADLGRLELDAPVAAYWPEFAAAGKESITVRQVLAHQAGLIAPEQDLTVPDLVAWAPVAEVLAKQAPLWAPGTAFAYHAVTMGFLAGEILRRATGERPSGWLRDHVAAPLRLEMGYGADLQDPNLAPIGEQLPDLDPATSAAALAAAASDLPLIARVMGMSGALDGLDLFRTANSSDFLSHESPAANLVTNARNLARFYAATVGNVDGIRLLTADVIRDARKQQSSGVPYLGPADGNRWATGFMINSPRREMLGPGSFGHDGAGGQLGFAHLEHEVGFGYQTIRPGGVPDDRAESLCLALRACL